MSDKAGKSSGSSHDRRIAERAALRNQKNSTSKSEARVTSPSTKVEKSVSKIPPKSDLPAIPETTPTILSQDNPKPEESLEKGTFWAKLWLKSIKPQIKRFAGLGFWLGAFTMIEINEFALAGVLLILSLIPFAIQIYEWEGITEHSVSTKYIKVFSFLIILTVVIYFGGVTYKSKGEKTWSMWFYKQPQPTSIIATTTPSTQIEQKLRGFLVPDNNPSPTNNCGKIPSNAVTLYFGGSAAWTTNTFFNLVTINHEHLLSIENTSNGLLINAVLRDEKGEVVARITKNVFQAKKNNKYESQSPDTHTIQVIDDKNRLILYVKYLNPKAIKALGIFQYPNHDPVIIDEDNQMLGRVQMAGGVCFEIAGETKGLVEY